MSTALKIYLVSLSLLGCMLSAQPFTAHNRVSSYPFKFFYGVSPSYYSGFNGGNSTVRSIVDLAPNAHVKGLRQVVLDQFMLDYGAEYELSNFKYFFEKDSIQMLSLYLNTPAAVHRSTDSISCATSSGVVRYRSESFANLYEPIWDDSVNGTTPVNEKNYFAKYVYSLAKSYNKYVKVYEVWNSPDFSNSLNADKVKGEPGNWWDANPNPCDLANLRASVIDYVRMLRITYEVVKSIDTSALVALGSIHRDNFLDAVLRNTDNPNGGLVSTAHPLKGGAYFDAVAYQSQPQYTLKEWDDRSQTFRYHRHSDAALAKVLDTKRGLAALLRKYGYNDTLYPSKQFLLSKVNIPRKQYPDRDFIGSVEAQRNFLMKLYIGARKNDIKYMNLFTMGDTRDEAASTSELEGNDLMGLYYNLNKATPASATLNLSGVGLKTLSLMLAPYEYHASLTSILLNTPKVDGAVFVKDNDTLMVLWGKTDTDLSEGTFQDYVLPMPFGGPHSLFDTYTWGYSSNMQVQQHYSNFFRLGAGPLVVRLNTYTNAHDALYDMGDFNLYPNPARGQTGLVCTAPVTNGQLVLTDLSGKVLLEREVNENHGSLDLSTLQPGMYQAVLKSNQGVRIKKLAVE